MIIRAPENQAEWEAYFDLRYQVLRAPLNQPRGSEKHEGDASGIHFAIFEHDVIVAIARLDYPEEEIAQVRFVAVATDLHGRGLGKKIMLAVEERCKTDHKQKLILHARDYAVDFYRKMNYSLVEPSYKLFGVLQHYLMEKHF